MHELRQYSRLTFPQTAGLKLALQSRGQALIEEGTKALIWTRYYRDEASSSDTLDRRRQEVMSKPELQ